MFGGETNSNRGLLIGAAIGMGRRMREEEAYHDATLANYQAVIDQLSEQLLATQIDLAAERCEIAGLRAFIGEMKRQGPDNPALNPSGRTYKSGKAKSIATIAYEQEYDRKADDFGLPVIKGTYAK